MTFGIVRVEMSYWTLLLFKKEVVILIHLLPEVKHCPQNAQLTQIGSNRTWPVGPLVIKVLDTGVSLSCKDSLPCFGDEEFRIRYFH